MACLVLFANTKFAWMYPGLAAVLIVPGFCLVTSKQIVCNVTEMEADLNNVNLMAFFLLLINRKEGKYRHSL